MEGFYLGAKEPTQSVGLVGLGVDTSDRVDFSHVDLKPRHKRHIRK
jgi:hypothetical protein